jgi:predicted nucleotidyltransferase component of viral defense system
MELIRYPDSVDPVLLELFSYVMQEKELKTFLLGGGTSLALRFGHRSSEDLDFFSREKFDTENLQNSLAEAFPGSQIVNRTIGSLCIVAEGINIDFLHHPFSLLEKADSQGQSRFLSLPDIAAMKINAVTNRGAKKDFFDLYLLHTIGVAISDSIHYFSRKYNGNRLLALRSLLWFEDAETEPDPILLNDWSWELVKKEISEIVGKLI